MIQLFIDEIEPGMVLGRSIFGATGGLQLVAGYTLDAPIIEQCRKAGVRSMWIRDDGADATPDGFISDQLALQAQRSIKDSLDNLRKIGEIQDITLDKLQTITGNPSRFKNIVVTEKMKGIVTRIMSGFLGKDIPTLNLSVIRSKDGYLYQHALDVTVTSIMLAQALKFTLKDTEELALGCFLMDLGMLIVPEAALSGERKMTAQDEALLRQHTAVGFTILKATEGFPINSAHVAYQHHERQDGQGYPRKLKGNNQAPVKYLGATGLGTIHRYAEVAAVADAYVAAIAPRPGLVAPMPPDEAIRMLIANAGTHLNRYVVQALTSMIPVFPVGARIVVGDGTKARFQGYSGVVAKSREDNRERPVVILLFDKFRKRIKPVLIDLLEEKGVQIRLAQF